MKFEVGDRVRLTDAGLVVYPAFEGEGTVTVVHTPSDEKEFPYEVSFDADDGEGDCCCYEKEIEHA